MLIARSRITILFLPYRTAIVNGPSATGSAPSRSDVKDHEPQILTEKELFDFSREEGFEIEYVLRSSTDDWDRYEADNWYGLVRWIEENPDHPELQEVIDHLHKVQDEYATFGREYFGWALYILNPMDHLTH